MAPTLIPLVIALAALIVVAGLGFLLPFPDLPLPPSSGLPPERVPVPTGVPAVVARYLRAVSLDGATLPRIRSLAYRGSGRARPFGVWLPLTHRTTVVPGALMWRELVVPWYGFALLRVMDTYDGGVGRTAVAGLVQQEARGARVDQGAFLALAAESIMAPSADALRGRWEDAGEHAAHLVVPFRGGEERLLVAFDPATGLPRRISARRYRGEAGPKIGWHIDLDHYRELGGLRVPTRLAAVWEDVGAPWSVWRIDALELDVGVPSGRRAAEERGATESGTAAEPMPAPLG